MCIFIFEIDLILSDIVAAAVLSGNRNFEGRVHPLTRANYLASPPLVVAYALAGTVCGNKTMTFIFCLPILYIITDHLLSARIIYFLLGLSHLMSDCTCEG